MLRDKVQICVRARVCVYSLEVSNLKYFCVDTSFELGIFRRASVYERGIKELMLVVVISGVSFAIQ